MCEMDDEMVDHKKHTQKILIEFCGENKAQLSLIGAHLSMNF